HTYREGNSVADSLANEGVTDMHTSFYSSTDLLPISTKLLMLQDSMQLRVLIKKVTSSPGIFYD
ncbi:unnamed protein product, partial [Ilex paraguariensis]